MAVVVFRMGVGGTRDWIRIRLVRCSGLDHDQCPCCSFRWCRYDERCVDRLVFNTICSVAPKLDLVLIRCYLCARLSCEYGDSCHHCKPYEPFWYVSHFVSPIVFKASYIFSAFFFPIPSTSISSSCPIVHVNGTPSNLSTILPANSPPTPGNP